MTEESGYVVRIERTFDASRRGRLRRVDQSRGDAALAPLRPGLGNADSRGRPPGRRKGPRRDAEARRHRSRKGGEYTLIDRPHRLVMTWTFDDDPSNEQLIELSFTEAEGSTTVLMVNSRIPTGERRDGQDEGWTQVRRRARTRTGRLIRYTHSRVPTPQSAKPAQAQEQSPGMTRSVASTYCNLREARRSAPTRRLPSAAASV